MSELDDQSEEVRGGKRGNTTGGGSISVTDSRVTRGINWAMGLLGTAAVLVGAWIGSTLVGLRESVAVIVSQNAALIQRLDKNEIRDDAQEQRINNIDGRVYSLEGRALRGGPGEARTNGR